VASRPSTSTSVNAKKKKKKKITTALAPNFSFHNDSSFMDEDSLTGEEEALSSSSTISNQMITIDQNEIITEEHLTKHFGCPYLPEINSHMKQTEGNHKAGSSYMNLQSDINPTMRGILVDWLVEVCSEFTLLPETLYLAVNITDRALSKFSIARNKLQMIGVTSLFISAYVCQLTILLKLTIYFK
jgi:hypothetical protein